MMTLLKRTELLTYIIGSIVIFYSLQIFFIYPAYGEREYYDFVLFENDTEDYDVELAFDLLNKENYSVSIDDGHLYITSKFKPQHEIILLDNRDSKYHGRSSDFFFTGWISYEISLIPDDPRIEHSENDVKEELEHELLAISEILGFSGDYKAIHWDTHEWEPAYLLIWMNYWCFPPLYILLIIVYYKQRRKDKDTNTITTNYCDSESPSTTMRRTTK